MLSEFYKNLLKTSGSQLLKPSEGAENQDLVIDEEAVIKAGSLLVKKYDDSEKGYYIFESAEPNSYVRFKADSIEDFYAQVILYFLT